MKFQTHVALQVTGTYEIEIMDSGGVRVFETSDPATSLSMPLFGEGATASAEYHDAMKNTAASMLLMRSLGAFLSKLPQEARTRLLAQITGQEPMEPKANA